MTLPALDIPKLAHSYRRLVLWFGAQLVINVLSVLPSLSPAPGPGAMTLSVLLLAGLLVTVAALAVYAYRVAAASVSRVPLLWAIAMFIPCLNAITLLAVSTRATNVCRANGIPVGLLGPKLPVAPLPVSTIGPR